MRSRSMTFARYADTISPPTLDHQALLGLLDQVRMVELPTEDGTAIGDAIVRAVDLLDHAPGAAKVIILLTRRQLQRGRGRAPGRGPDRGRLWHQDPHHRGRLARHRPGPGRRRRGQGRLRLLAGHHRRADPAADRAVDRRQVLPGDRRGDLRSIYAEIDRLEKAPNVALHQQRYVELFQFSWGWASRCFCSR